MKLTPIPLSCKRLTLPVKPNQLAATKTAVHQSLSTTFDVFLSTVSPLVQACLDKLGFDNSAASTIAQAVAFSAYLEPGGGIETLSATLTDIFANALPIMFLHCSSRILASRAGPDTELPAKWETRYSRYERKLQTFSPVVVANYLKPCCLT